ncbi:CRISPR-associated DxTHG motif protein [Fervidobacterium thailandense]|uniref:TIGR02221 family CRISPR-associated protein n=1 Tax=Fervidobacterium thailandense TaxID=1008305 RepID=A0A1E3G0A5_9BACT|nr:TM1812 family CRISPR-associated protein [Fervidobacterium thailandense]ODN29652.1 hypothetical protein A4H02_09595 [Fervidobacterium thailandense]
MGHKLVAALGVGSNYQLSTLVSPRYPEISGISNRLFPASLIEFLRKTENVEIDEVLFLGTERSFSSCGNLIEEEIVGKLGIAQNKIKYILIYDEDFKNSNIEKAIGRMLSDLKNHFTAGDVVYFDMTHSFRFIPFFSTVLIMYLQAVLQNVDIRLYYGLFEPGNPNSHTILVDLSKLTNIAKWIYASNLFIEYGYTIPISRLLSSRAREIYKNTEIRQKPVKISGLSSSFEKFSNSIRAGIWVLIEESARELDNKLKEEKLRNEIQEFIPELEPLLPRIEQKVRSISPNELNILEMQRQMIKFYLESNDLGMAFRLAREFTVNCAMVALHKGEYLFDRSKREEVERLIALKNNDPNWKIFSAIFQLRNSYAHFGFNSDAKSVNLESDHKRLAEFLDKFKSAAELVEFIRQELLNVSYFTAED